MAYLEKRGKNSWRLNLSLGTDDNGERIRKRITIHAKNKTEAKKQATILEAEYLNKGYIPDNDYTVESFFLFWLKNHKMNLKRTTYSGYEMIVKKHVIPTLGRIKLSDLNSIHIQKYYNNKLKNGRVNRKGGLSSTTVHGHHLVIHHALKDAENKGFIDKNPARAGAVEVPQIKNNQEIKILNSKQIEELLDKYKKYYPTNYPIIYFTLYTGLRRGEVLGLRWKDVNFNKETISIKNNLLRNPNGGDPIQTSPKTETSSRTIPLIKNTFQILKNKRDDHIQKGIFSSEQLIFSDINGDPLRPSAFSKRFSRLINKCSFKIRFHDLRHIHATILHELGVTYKTIQSRLGHSTIQTTLDTYTHDSVEIQTKELEKLENSNYNISLDI